MPLLSILTVALAAWAVWALFHGPSHGFWVVFGAPAGWAVLLFAFFLLVGAHAAWAVLWWRPPRAIERRHRRGAMASLALLSSLPYSLWLAVVCWAFFEPSILGSGGDPMMRTLSGRPVPAMMGAIWMSTYYLREAPRRMSNSGPSTAEIGLGIGGCVGLFFFVLIMTAR